MAWRGACYFNKCDPKVFWVFFNHALSKDVLCQVLYDIGWINCYREEDDGNIREQFTTILTMTILTPTTENFQSERHKSRVKIRENTVKCWQSMGFFLSREYFAHLTSLMLVKIRTLDLRSALMATEKWVFSPVPHYSNMGHQYSKTHVLCWNNTGLFTMTKMAICFSSCVIFL